MESFNGNGHLQHRRPPLFPSRMLDHLHVLRVFKKKCFPLLFQWWFSLLNVARVLQVWWKVAAHFGENLWLLVENIRRVGNKKPKPKNSTSSQLCVLFSHPPSNPQFCPLGPHRITYQKFLNLLSKISKKTSPKSEHVLTFFHQ